MWGDIDWKRQSVRIARAKVRHVIKTTKTHLERDIDLTDRMIAVLRRQKAHSFMRGLDTPVFLNPLSGTPWPDVQDQRKLYFHPALRAIGFRSRDAYQTRHTYATLALMSGVNPLTSRGSSGTRRRRCCFRPIRSGSMAATMVARHAR